MSKSKETKIGLTLDSKGILLLEKLQKELNTKSKADVLRRAINVLHFLTKMKQLDGSIDIKIPDSEGLAKIFLS